MIITATHGFYARRSREGAIIIFNMSRHRIHAAGLSGHRDQLDLSNAFGSFDRDAAMKGADNVVDGEGDHIFAKHRVILACVEI